MKITNSRLQCFSTWSTSCDPCTWLHLPGNLLLLFSEITEESLRSTHQQEGTVPHPHPPPGKKPNQPNKINNKQRTSRSIAKTVIHINHTLRTSLKSPLLNNGQMQKLQTISDTVTLTGGQGNSKQDQTVQFTSNCYQCSTNRSINTWARMHFSFSFLSF